MKQEQKTKKQEKKEGIKEEGFVGIDLGKRELQACRLKADGKTEYLKFKTDNEAISQLLKWLRPNDQIAMEAGNQSFRIARLILAKSHCKVHVLNPGDLANIYRSLKKTDKEDALKLARLIARIPTEELPIVPVPSEETEKLRSLLSEQEHFVKQVTASKNRLHSIFTEAGITNLSKKHLAAAKSRLEWISQLPERFKSRAERMNKSIEHAQATLKEVQKEVREILKKEPAYCALALSIPGLGPTTTATFYAFLGDCRRFSSAKQVAYYSGLVPKIDISGDCVRYGPITKRGAHLFRRPLIQAAWSLVRSPHGGNIKAFYERLYQRIGKKKAIVATARKITEVFYAMVKSGTLYESMPEDVLRKKILSYGLGGA